MPFSPDVQQLIQQVERLSDRPVHVMEEAELRNRATVTPGHIIRFRPDFEEPFARMMIATILTQLRSLYKGLVGDMTKNFKHLRKTRHTHHPVDDAKGNAEALLAMRDGMELNLRLS